MSRYETCFARIQSRVCPLAVLWLVSVCLSVAMGQSTRVDRRIPNFVLPDSNGKQVAISDFNDSRAVVVVFMGTQCPIGNAYVPDLNKLAQDYSEKGVQVVGINSNLSDTPQEVAEHAEEFGIAFPVLVDSEQLAADIFRAQRTPDVFVLDHRRNVRYAGRIDDRVGYTFKRSASKRNDLIEAVDELVAGKDVSVAETKSMGCKITRKSHLTPKGEVTYANQVAAIMFDRCATCHHADTAAPFSLLTYEETRDWAEMIHEVVTDRRMPPWDIDPRFGKFKNDLRMTKEEIDTVVAWIDAGAPLGDVKELPDAPNFEPGWMIGKPDIVFKMPEEYPVPASGTVEYQYFVTPTNFEQDMWVRAAEPRPGNRSVVHHIIVYVRPAGSTKTNGLPMVAGFAPGEEPTVYAKGVGFKIPAKSELVWQVHYTPYGKPENDCSELGLVFCDEPPARHIQGGGIFNTSFEIPPGENNHLVVKSKKFTTDMELLSLMPHMHVRGKDFKYVAHFPNGESKVLLSVPDYDFNWQHSYKFAEPVSLPAGTRIECVAHFDNSDGNPANPDPDKLVTWGDQTWEEMMIGWYSYVEPQTDSSTISATPVLQP